MASDVQLLDEVYQTSQAWAELGTECQSLPFGVVVTHPEFPSHHEGNCVWNVRLDDCSAADAFRQVEAFFAHRGLICFGWTPALEQSVDALGTLLEPEGYVRAESLAMALDRPMQERDLLSLELVSARLHPQHYEAVFHLPAQRFSLYMAPIHLKRLRFPQYEAYAALLDGEPVGRIGLLTGGDVGRIKSVFVGGDHRRLGVATAMLSHVVSKCRARGCRSVCLEVDADNVQAVRCYERFGFRTVGIIRTFTRQ